MPSLHLSVPVRRVYRHELHARRLSLQDTYVVVRLVPVWSEVVPDDGHRYDDGRAARGVAVVLGDDTDLGHEGGRSTDISGSNVLSLMSTYM